MEGVVESITTTVVVKTPNPMTDDVPTPTLNEFLDLVVDEEQVPTVDTVGFPGVAGTMVVEVDYCWPLVGVF